MPLPSDPRRLERLALSFRGLAHPTRLQILAALDRDGALSPTQLASRIRPKISLGTVAHHTRELRTLGLIDPAGTEPVRGALQHFYRLSPHGRSLLELVERLAD